MTPFSCLSLASLPQRRFGARSAQATMSLPAAALCSRALPQVLPLIRPVVPTTLGRGRWGGQLTPPCQPTCHRPWSSLPTTVQAHSDRHHRALALQAVPGPDVVPAADILQLEEILPRIRGALRVSPPLTEEVVVRGTGRHLGTDIGWQVCLRPDGAFVEEVTGAHMSFSWGHDGSRNSNCWEVDDYGVSKHLELDDHESLMLAQWVRSCYWLWPGLLDCLEVTLLPETEPPDEVNKSNGNGASAMGGSGSVTLGLRMLTGKMQAKIRVCTETWQPLEMVQMLCGDAEMWQYRGWQQYCGGLTHPTEVVHQGGAGGEHCYTTTGVELRSLAAVDLSYSIPPSAITPKDTRYLPESSPKVPAWYTRSGHVLVQPKVDGKEIGYMILDTGASGFVVEKSAADKLGLEAFGELYVSGMAGKIQCQFRRAQTVEIGPLVMERPLFMEMMLGGLVRGAPGPVVGIVGYEIFRRAVVELPSRQTRSDGEYDLRFHNPAEFESWPELDEQWQEMTMVANLPHVKVDFARTRDSAPAVGTFMLDSGAGGVDAMFHNRAASELGLLDNNSNNFRFIKGVGGEDMSGIKVQSGELAWMELSTHKLNGIKCLFGGSGGLDLSLHTSGIICADLMSRMHVVVDYARKRIAFLPPDTRNTSDQ